MHEIVKVKAKEKYTVWIKFADGREKTVNLQPFIGKGFSKELLDKEKFHKVFVEPGGGIAWDNGYDCCADFLNDL